MKKTITVNNKKTTFTTRTVTRQKNIMGHRVFIDDGPGQFIQVLSAQEAMDAVF